MGCGCGRNKKKKKQRQDEEIQRLIESGSEMSIHYASKKARLFLTRHQMIAYDDNVVQKDFPEYDQEEINFLYDQMKDSKYIIAVDVNNGDYLKEIVKKDYDEDLKIVNKLPIFICYDFWGDDDGYELRNLFMKHLSFASEKVFQFRMRYKMFVNDVKNFEIEDPVIFLMDPELDVPKRFDRIHRKYKGSKFMGFIKNGDHEMKVMKKASDQGLQYKREGRVWIMES